MVELIDTRLCALDVLIVEDEPLNQLVLRAMLGKFNCTVCLANEGMSALNKLSREKFDLVFMDIQMPMMDGVEATSRIRSGEAGEMNRDIPIVAYTTSNSHRDRELFSEVGMCDCLNKPISFKRVKEILEKYSSAEQDSQERGSGELNPRTHNCAIAPF